MTVHCYVVWDLPKSVNFLTQNSIPKTKCDFNRLDGPAILFTVFKPFLYLGKVSEALFSSRPSYKKHAPDFSNIYIIVDPAVIPLPFSLTPMALGNHTNVREVILEDNGKLNRPIPQCTCFKSHNAPFRIEMCVVWDRCIVGFVNVVYWYKTKHNKALIVFITLGICCTIVISFWKQLVVVMGGGGTPSRSWPLRCMRCRSDEVGPRFHLHGEWQFIPYSVRSRSRNKHRDLWVGRHLVTLVPVQNQLNWVL